MTNGMLCGNTLHYMVLKNTSDTLEFFFVGRRGGGGFDASLGLQLIIYHITITIFLKFIFAAYNVLTNYCFKEMKVKHSCLGYHFTTCPFEWWVLKYINVTRIDPPPSLGESSSKQ